MELTILIKEHFNRWYSLKAYYTSVTLLDLPISVSPELFVKSAKLTVPILGVLLSHIHADHIFSELTTDGIVPIRNVLCDQYAGRVCRPKFGFDDWRLVQCCGEFLQFSPLSKFVSSAF